MCGVNKALQRIRTAVRLMDCVQRHSVITPSVIAREGSDRHQLDVRDTEFIQIIEPVNRCIERSLWREGAHVQLVDHGAG